MYKSASKLCISDVGEPPDIIGEWADKVIKSWKLTKSQEEVIRILLKGFSDQEIADVLQISLKSVKEHMRIIHNRTGFHSRAEIFAEILRL